MPLELHWNNKNGELATRLQGAWEQTDALRAEMLKRAALKPSTQRMTIWKIWRQHLPDHCCWAERHSAQSSGVSRSRRARSPGKGTKHMRSAKAAITALPPSSP